MPAHFKTRSRCLVGLVMIVFLALALTGSGCTRKPLSDRRDALRPATTPLLDDDLPLEPLLDAIAQQIVFLEKSPTAGPFIFGERTIPRDEYLVGLRRFVELGRNSSSREAFFAAVQQEFDFFEVYGQKKWGDTFVTAYYEPVMKGSLKKQGPFTQPLYRQPDDLLAIDLAIFDDRYGNERKLRGRLIGKKIFPYFTREDIDSSFVLQGRGLELCWLDPVDAFIVHVQGSAVIDLESGGRMRVAYAEKNGHRYESLAGYLERVIPKDKMSLQAIEGVLRRLPVEELRRILNLNPSYVFFRAVDPAAKADSGLRKAASSGSVPIDPSNLKVLPLGALPTASDIRPPTSIGLPAVDGRSIATDARFFPKGALGFLVTTKPRFDGPDQNARTGSEPMQRFVLDHDTGGAIVGGGRVDVFWGQGDVAKRYAGWMKERGTLYYLAPKQFKKTQ